MENTSLLFDFNCSINFNCVYLENMLLTMFARKLEEKLRSSSGGLAVIGLLFFLSLLTIGLLVHIFSDRKLPSTSPPSGKFSLIFRKTSNRCFSLNVLRINSKIDAKMEMFYLINNYLIYTVYSGGYFVSSFELCIKTPLIK